MKHLPITSDSPVLRTDFSDQPSWEAVCEAIGQPSDEGFQAYVEFIDDRAFEGLTKQQLLAAIPAEYPHTFIIVVDRKSISDAEHPLLVVNLYDGLGSEVGEEFRALPSQIHAIQNNLSIANVDFSDFAGAVDGDGVFRGL
jgi:hypothetical protein